MRLLSPSSLEVESDRVWRRLGYTDPRRAPRKAELAFGRALELGRASLDPQAVYDIFPIAAVTPSAVKLKGVCLESRELVARCRGAQELAVFIATIGPLLEEKVEQLFRSEPPVALILDNYGSEAVVALAHQVRAAVGKYAGPKGYRVGKRYCPGYGDWATKEQRKLFDLLDGGRTGVKLGPGEMMWPRKSYAGVLPLGLEVAEVEVDERCPKE